MGLRDHWESIYGKKPTDQVSWYAPHLARSLELIHSAKLALDAAVIDVGGGASTLVDDLLDLGYSDVTLLDLSSAAIEVARHRLGARAHRVHWIVGDITTIDLQRARYDFWHDRAVFHFLVDEADRRRYVHAVRRALKQDGHIVVATFGPDGPTQCSGLDGGTAELKNSVHIIVARPQAGVASHGGVIDSVIADGYQTLEGCHKYLTVAPPAAVGTGANGLDQRNHLSVPAATLNLEFETKSTA